MNKLAAAALLVAALALAGCGAGTSNAPEAVKAAPGDVETVANVTTVDAGQEWADEQMNQFIGAYGLSSLAEFEVIGGVESEITDWEAGATGEMILTIPDSAYTAPHGYVSSTELHDIGDSFMVAVGDNFDDLKEVTVQTESRTASETTSREDYPYLDR